MIVYTITNVDLFQHIRYKKMYKRRLGKIHSTIAANVDPLIHNFYDDIITDLNIEKVIFLSDHLCAQLF